VAAKRIVVFRAETGPDSPFWTVGGVGLDYGFFPSPVELVTRLRGWCQATWDVAEETEPWEPWNAEGHLPFEETAAILSADVDLRWDPGNDERD
jgi:hypothetical protein